jgi:CheY-like chemotaxis protein
VDQTNSKKSPIILVVDDEILNREMLQICLTSDGYEVLLAPNGEKALEIIAERHPDLVLTDVRMHGMSGYQLCAALKADESTRSIPVALVTGLGSDEDKQQGIKAGADDFIEKPLNLPVMLNRIKSLVRIKHLRDLLDNQNRRVEEVLLRHLDAATVATIMAELKDGQANRR